MNKLLGFIRARQKFILFSVIKAIVMILSLLTNIFIVRKLSVNDFGVFSIALMLVGLITTFGFSWSSSSILYYGSKERAKYGSINKTFWARNIIISISLVLTTILFVVFNSSINDYIGMDLSLLILIWLYISVAEDYLSQYYLAIKKQVFSSLLSITAKVIYLILILVFDFDVETLILFNIISHASVLFYMIGINRNDISKFEFDKNWFLEVLNFSVWQLFGYSGLYLINFGDTAVIKYFMSSEDVGIYNAAYKIFNAIANFTFVISSYYAGNISQYFAKKEYVKIRNFFYRERFIIFGLSLFLHLIIILFSKPIILFLYGVRYVESISILNVLLIGSVFRYITVFYMLYYNTNNKYRLQQVINIFRAIINIILDIIFIKIFGLIGPAIATTVAMFLAFVFSLFYCEKRIYGLSKSDNNSKCE